MANIRANPNYTSYNGTEEDRANHPEKATISTEKFLTKEGLVLYQLALEEEMNSQEYRDAVFCASTSYFPGEKWVERPVVTVSGPSGCGKSYAAQEAVRTASGELKTNPDDTTGNYVVAVDGGVGREVSQMRKLLIQTANDKGFSGVKDLDKQSSVLGKVKGHVQRAAFANPQSTLGVVIPDTFSQWPAKSSDRSRIHKVDNMPNTKQIFCRVDGEDPSTFQNVVGFMGSRRAWKTDGFTSESGAREKLIDMNNTQGLKESKAYHGGWKFLAGVNGSRSAQAYFVSHSKTDNLTMQITNDLILIKADKDENHAIKPNEWSVAAPGEEGEKLISRRTFDAWKASAEPRLDLDAFIKENPQKPLISMQRNDAQQRYSLSSRAQRSMSVAAQSMGLDKTASLDSMYASAVSFMSKMNEGLDLMRKSMEADPTRSRSSTVAGEALAAMMTELVGLLTKFVDMIKSVMGMGPIVEAKAEFVEPVMAQAMVIEPRGIKNIKGESHTIGAADAPFIDPLSALSSSPPPSNEAPSASQQQRTAFIATHELHQIKKDAHAERHVHAAQSSTPPASKPIEKAASSKGGEIELTTTNYRTRMDKLRSDEKPVQKEEQQLIGPGPGSSFKGG
jgi:hypothetical protein